MLRRLFKREPAFITVVSGLPRSGTSMMMKMLEAGGIPPIQDGIRQADDDNPKGYYEFERVKKLDKGDTAWLNSAESKSVKIISYLLTNLPQGHHYRVLFMRRDLDEVLASQTKMLIRRGEQKTTNDAEMKQLFRKHLQQVETFMAKHPTLTTIDVDYAALAKTPAGQLPQISAFLGGSLDTDAMLTVPDQKLYRNKQTQTT